MTVRIETLAEGVTLYCGDCIPAMQSMDANSVDACVTDPPYGLSFMGKAWDHGVPGVEYWKEVLRVLKPGAHLLAFGGTRTFGRMHVAIEDAGFEIRDMISWLYGSGFPKSLDVSKAMDRAAGAERDVVGSKLDRPGYHLRGHSGGEALGHGLSSTTYETRLKASQITAAATDAARQWSGFGTALKPACEPIVLARKPLSESTVAANVLKWGTGALNIDGCRVGVDVAEPNKRRATGDNGGADSMFGVGNSLRPATLSDGRWPANIIHDGSDEVVGAFPDAPGQQRALLGGEDSKAEIYGKFGPKLAHEPRNDSGSAARFFYTAKADSDDRLGSKHPTVKPLDLMQYLVRLVTPPRGLVLDCFAGTGTTAEACVRERMRCIVIEREEEYQADIRRRISLAMAGADTRKRATAAERNKDKPVDHGPLFGGLDTPPHDSNIRDTRASFTSALPTNDWPDRTQVVNK